MQTLLVWLKKLDHAVSVTTRTICIVALAAIFVMFLLNVFVRFVPVYNFMQTDDWIQLCLVWMISWAPRNSCAPAVTLWWTF